MKTKGPTIINALIREVQFQKENVCNLTGIRTATEQESFLLRVNGRQTRQMLPHFFQKSKDGIIFLHKGHNSAHCCALEHLATVK